MRGESFNLIHFSFYSLYIIQFTYEALEQRVVGQNSKYFEFWNLYFTFNFTDDTFMYIINQKSNCLTTWNVSV